MKRLILISTMAVVVCLAGFCSGQEKAAAKKSPSNSEKLKPLAYFLGTWELTGEVKLANQPTVSFVFERVFKWDLGNNFIQSTMSETKDGKTELRHRSMIGWEAKTQKITEWGFWNANLPTEAPTWAEAVTWSKESQKWRIERDGVNGLYTIIDPNTHKYECTFRGEDGSENSWHFTAKRKTAVKVAEAAKTVLPDNIVKELKFFAGEWTAEGTLAGKPLKGNWSARWTPQKQCLLISSQLTLDGEQVSSNGVSGWDAGKQEIVTVQFFSNGVMEDTRYKLASPGLLKGVYTLATEGEPLKVDCEVLSKQPDEWTFKSTANAFDGKKGAEFTIRFLRSGAKPKKEAKK